MGNKTREGKINLNEASREELMGIEGIGGGMADAIIDYRSEKGGFESVEELTNVFGLGGKKLEQIKDRLSV
jgi:competence protein ComEA